MDETLKTFIRAHADDDTHRLLLSAHRYPGIDMSLVVQQLEGRRKAVEKFPSLLACEDFLFPVKLSMEQCSSEQTANYKAGLVKGFSVADLTGGLGIDALFMSKAAKSLLYVEKNEELYAIGKHNFAVLNANIETFCSDGIDFLRNSTRHFDCLYLDPARRDEQRNRVVQLQACDPNILENKDMFFAHAPRFLLKASPMLDISQAIRELNCVKHLHVLAVRNECKELLFECEQNATKAMITCVNIERDRQMNCTFSLAEETTASVDFARKPAAYLYEPNVTLLKAGAFRWVAQQFNLLKLHPDTHLYTSDQLCVDFPGRVFEIVETFSLNKKEITRLLPLRKVNVAVRNFPMKPEEIQRKFGLTDGGNDYLFAVTLFLGTKCAVLCRKIDGA